MVINIFYLEDDDIIIKQFKEAVSRYNNENGITINLTTVNQLEEAEKIDLMDFDCAIIDLKIGNTNGAGSSYISKIYGKLIRLPTIIYTGTPNDIPDNIPIMKTFSKSEDKHTDVIEYIHQIYKTGLTKILGAKGTFEKTLHNVFKDIMILEYEGWVNYIKNDEVDVEKSLLRHILNNIYYLLNNEHEKFVPEEYYLKYHSEKNISTGLICNYDEKKYMIITPACDLANSKTTYIQLIEIDSFDMVKDDYNKVKRKMKSEKDLKKIVNNNNIYCYHFLPKTQTFDQGYLNFRKLCSVGKEFFDKKIESKEIKPEAQISPYFMKDIIARFSSYYARQGQPLIILI